MCPYLRLLDQNVKIAFMSQMPRGQLGVGTASPEDIRPSSPLDCPTGILVYNKTGECGPADDLPLIVDRGLLAYNEPECPLGKNPGI